MQGKGDLETAKRGKSTMPQTRPTSKQIAELRNALAAGLTEVWAQNAEKHAHIATMFADENFTPESLADKPGAVGWEDIPWLSVRSLFNVLRVFPPAAFGMPNEVPSGNEVVRARYNQLNDSLKWLCNFHVKKALEHRR